MSTYFVYYTAHLTTGDKDRNILVNSDRSGRELYRQIQDAIDAETFYDDASYTIKNIVCLDSVPGTQMPEENPLRVTHSSRPDLEISLDIGGTYNDRMDVNFTDKSTGETRSMCFEMFPCPDGSVQFEYPDKGENFDIFEIYETEFIHSYRDGYTGFYA